MYYLKPEWVNSIGIPSKLSDEEFEDLEPDYQHHYYYEDDEDWTPSEV